MLYAQVPREHRALSYALWPSGEAHDVETFTDVDAVGLLLALRVFLHFDLAILAILFLASILRCFSLRFFYLALATPFLSDWSLAKHVQMGSIFILLGHHCHPLTLSVGAHGLPTALGHLLGACFTCKLFGIWKLRVFQSRAANARRGSCRDLLHHLLLEDFRHLVISWNLCHLVSTKQSGSPSQWCGF